MTCRVTSNWIGVPVAIEPADMIFIEGNSSFLFQGMAE